MSAKWPLTRSSSICWTLLS